MNAYIILSIFAGLFLVLPIIWKSKGVYVFLILCASNILSASVSGTLTNEIRDLAKTDGIPLQSIVKGTLLLLPPLLAILITRKSAKKKTLPLHIFALVATAVLAYLWFIRILPFEQFSSLESANLTKQLLRVRDMALVAGILASLTVMFLERPKHEDGKHKKKH